MKGVSIPGAYAIHIMHVGGIDILLKLKLDASYILFLEA